MNIKNKKIFLLLFSFVILAFPQTVNAFDNGVFWEYVSYSTSSSKAGTGETNKFVIIDSDLSGNGGLDQLSVTVESKDSSSTIIETLNLILTESIDDGTFDIDHMLFMIEESEVELDDTVLITVEDPCDEALDTDGNCDIEKSETLSGASGESVLIYSDTHTSGIEIDLFETGPNTGIFTRSLTFSISGSDAVNAILHVSPGDVFTIQDQKTSSKLTNGLVSGDPNRYAILVEETGTVEVTATSDAGSTVTDTTTITASGASGRGSGGLVNPGLVVDNPSSNDFGGSGCSGDCVPPTLGIDKNYNQIVKNGFSYNNNPIDVELYFTPYPLVTVNVGQENNVILKVYENSGSENIEHIGIGFGLGEGTSFSDSKATINVDRTRDGDNLISTFDPDHVFENIRVISETGKCNDLSQMQCMIFTIFHTFREPLEFNMVSTYVWDFNGNSWQNYYNHGIHIIGDSLNPPKTKSIVFGTHDMRGLYTLTQIDKFEDKWIDEFGNVYQHKGNDRFDKISSIPKEIVYDYVTMHGCDRLCNWFENYKLNQELLAKIEIEKMMMGKDIINDQKGFVSPTPYIKTPRSENTDLQNNIKNETLKAMELFKESFDVKNNF